MTELLIFAVFFAVMALACTWRIKKGPSAADRVVAADSADSLLCCALILFAMFSGRGIYLDIAIVGALFGIIDTMLVGRYLERRL